MHEMALAESVLRIVEQAAQSNQARRVTSVWLEIGMLSSVEPEAMRACFDAVVRDTVAHGARLEISTIGGAAKCETCGHEYALDVLDTACPGCGGYSRRLVAGGEMRVKGIEVL